MIQQVTIFYWVLCHIISYFFANYSKQGEPVNAWDHFGWLWWKFGVLLLLICSMTKKDNKLEVYWRMLIIFFVVKIGWNIFAIITNRSINDPIGVKVLFILISAFLCYLTIQDQWQKSKRSISS